MNPIEVLELLENTSGNNAKIDVLKQHPDDQLKRLLNLAYDPHTKFHVKQIPDYNSISRLGEQEGLDKFFNLSQALSQRALTGNKALEAIKIVLSLSSPVQAKWFERILKKDLRINMGSSLVNKAYPGLIYKHKIMKPVPMKDALESIEAGKFTFPLWADLKMDGYRCTITLWDMKCLSSSGREFENWTVITDELKERLKDENYVLDGEILYDGDDASEFNGIQKSAFKKGGPPPQNIIFRVFDVLTKNEWLAKKCEEENVLERRCRFYKAVNWTALMKTDLCQGGTIEDAGALINFYQKVIARGGEGLVIKYPGPYEWKRAKHWIKLKAQDSIDVRIKGFIPGTGKHEGKLGAIVYAYGRGDAKVGTGFSDEQREDFWNRRDELLGKHMEVEFFKDTNLGTTRHSRFVRLRPDKD